MQLREVSDQEYETAYKSPDNRKVINAVLKKYRKQLSYEDLRSFGMIGLLKTLQRHDSSFGQKFTSNLHKFVNWQCIDALRALNSGVKTTSICSFPNLQDAVASDISQYIEGLEPLEQQIITMKICNRMSHKEIGAKLAGRGAQWSRSKFNNAIAKIRRTI